METTHFKSCTYRDTERNQINHDLNGLHTNGYNYPAIKDNTCFRQELATSEYLSVNN